MVAPGSPHRPNPGRHADRRAELARPETEEKGSNDDWTHPHDPDAKIAKMSWTSRTHLGDTAELEVVDPTRAIVGTPCRTADDGDTTRWSRPLITAAEQVEAVAEVVGDKGYHSNETMVAFADLGVRSYVSEPDRGRRHWIGQGGGPHAVYANRSAAVRRVVLGGGAPSVAPCQVL